MRTVRIPERYNYIAAFLTLACNLRCSFCINRFGGTSVSPVRPMAGGEWVSGINRLVTRPDLPVTLQGGEPSLHPDFIEIINGIRPDIPIDLLTNLTFDVEEFARRVRPERLRRSAPYASIRVSYHPETMDLDPLLERVLYLKGREFSIGIWGVLHPDYQAQILDAQGRCVSRGIDFRTKEFLGWHDGRLHGNIRYEGACEGRRHWPVLCRTSELLIGPKGQVFRCHSDLYADRSPAGNLLDPNFVINESFRQCDNFGECNPCDVKVKTNRFQEFGHTSVEIRLGPQAKAAAVPDATPRDSISGAEPLDRGGLNPSRHFL
jgi:hypothetical protein